jgi:magnesium transporter
VVFSFWGQNVEVPFKLWTHGYPITLAVAFGISAILALVFWRKKFF